MTEYAVNQQVEGTVERVLSFGVFVRLDDNTRAYIRRRELDLDADVDPSHVIHEGERLKGIVLSLGAPGKDIELSRRALLRNPWPDFVQHYQAGDTVKCMVQTLRPHGLFVRIQPGIDGFVPLDELALNSQVRLGDVFWKGDDIEALISRIDAKRKQINLSIAARIRQYDEALKASGTVVRKSKGKAAKTTRSLPQVQGMQDGDRIDPEKVGPILVVEDDDHVRQSLIAWLIRKGLHAASAKTVAQAKAMASSDFNVLLVDLNLLENDGLELIYYLRKKNSRANICIMSSPEMLAERAHDIELAQVMGVFPKPLDLGEIEHFLLQVARNKHLSYWRANHQVSQRAVQSALVQFSESETDVRLQKALEKITSALQAQHGVIFYLDRDSQNISVAIHTGRFHVNQAAIYGLVNSPVNDVIKEGSPVFANKVHEKSAPRFVKLLDLFDFGSCIGVPIDVQGEVRHAAFFFHSRADVFSVSRLHDAEAGAMLLSAVLAEDSIQTRLRALNPMLLSGELAASFGHDVFNKITALELETRNLIESEETNPKKHSENLLELVLDLKNIAQAFQQMLRTKEQMEMVDVNPIVRRVNLLLRDLARAERTQVVLNLATDLPCITGNGVLLQQAFSNVMLNAIQQMAQKREKLKWTGTPTLEVATLLRGNKVQVRFKDNGPGIHKESLQKIFRLGFSTRGGSGLGLYIARSFLQMLGGSIQIEETFIPLGTTFLVELPVGNQEKPA